MDQNKSSLPLLDWGYWPLWIIAFVSASSAVIIRLVPYDWELYVLLVNLVGIIVGIVVGFMPWLAHAWRSSEVGWWICTITALIVTIIAIAFTNLLPSLNSFYWDFGLYISRWIISVAIESLVVAFMIRRVCKQWLKSEAGWREWTWAGVKIFGIFILMFVFLFIFWNSI
jgi:hypothetical protein